MLKNKKKFIQKFVFEPRAKIDCGSIEHQIILLLD